MSALPKFESQIGDEWVAHQFPKVFCREQTKGSLRLKIAASENGTQILLRLASCLAEPFGVLYILVVYRGGGQPGRYQSPWLTRAELDEFLAKFGSYFEQDGRHHVWIHSPSEEATLVYDRHNVIFAYGPLEKYVNLLSENGYTETESLSLQFPHQHHFHAELDSFERELTALAGWRHTALRDGDEI